MLLFVFPGCDWVCDRGKHVSFWGSALILNFFLFIRSQKEREIRHKIKKGEFSGIPDDVLKNLPTSFFKTGGSTSSGGGGSRGDWPPPKFDDGR